jgi:hypothetical protein
MAAGQGARRGPDGVPDRWPDGVASWRTRRGRTGCPTGPDGGPTGQTGWRTEGLFIFKRKNDMFCIRVM